MTEPNWRPGNEAAATGTTAVFLEWLQATMDVTLDGPAALAAWRRDENASFSAAVLAFAGLGVGPDPLQALLAGLDERPALCAWAGSAWRVSTRAALRAAVDPPSCIAPMVRAVRSPDLPKLAASHLLDADTRPDDRLLWAGDADDPWPLGAWLVGATLLLAPPGDAASTAQADGARTVRAAPLGWRD